MKAVLAALALVLITPTTASAGTPNPDNEEIGWFSPTFTNSPVNLIVCAVPESCSF